MKALESQHDVLWYWEQYFLLIGQFSCSKSPGLQAGAMITKYLIRYFLSYIAKPGTFVQLEK